MREEMANHSTNGTNSIINQQNNSLGEYSGEKKNLPNSDSYGISVFYSSKNFKNVSMDKLEMYSSCYHVHCY